MCLHADCSVITGTLEHTHIHTRNLICSSIDIATRDGFVVMAEEALPFAGYLLSSMATPRALHILQIGTGVRVDLLSAPGLPLFMPRSVTVVRAVSDPNIVKLTEATGKL